MSAVTFLLDENIPFVVVDAIAGTEPAVEVFHYAQLMGTLGKGASDPQVLAFAEEHGYALVTFDKRSMPGHVADHLAAGRHTWGVFIFPNGNTLGPGRIAEELVLVWATSQQDEWVDRIEYLPY